MAVYCYMYNGGRAACEQIAHATDVHERSMSVQLEFLRFQILAVARPAFLLCPPPLYLSIYALLCPPPLYLSIYALPPSIFPLCLSSALLPSIFPGTPKSVDDPSMTIIRYMFNVKI